MADKHFLVRKGLSIGNNSPSVTVHITANDAVLIPVGTTAQRPTGVNGYFRYNSNTTAFEMYANSAWKTVADTTQLLRVYDSSNTQVFP